MIDESLSWPLNLDGKKIPEYIVVEGPIGAGKTTLTKKLAQTFNYRTLLEQADENPFLERFYADEHNSALPTQLFFLFQRIKQVSELRQSDIFKPVRVADFLIEKDQLFAQVTLEEEALKLYRQVYDQLTINAPKPDLVVYLQAPIDVLLARIKQRGIQFEQNIDAGYLRKLNEAYASFFHYYDDAPLLIVNVQDLDWVNNPADYKMLVERMLEVTSGRHYFNPQPTVLL